VPAAPLLSSLSAATPARLAAATDFIVVADAGHLLVLFVANAEQIAGPVPVRFPGLRGPVLVSDLQPVQGPDEAGVGRTVAVHWVHVALVAHGARRWLSPAREDEVH
jgi:hypothetical protein